MRKNTECSYKRIRGSLSVG